MASSPGDSDGGEPLRPRASRRAVAFAALLVAVVLPGVSCPAASSTTAPTEDQVKAAFLLNFSKYVEWPPTVFVDASSPIVLTVMADPKIEKELRHMAEGRMFNGRRLEVRSADRSDAIGDDCRILFIGVAEEHKASRIIAGLGARHILTVGECDDFFDDGGVIKLTRRDRKIRLEINLDQAEAAGLKISSKLLGVADLVKRREKGKT